MKFVVLEYAFPDAFSLFLTDRTQVTSSDSAGSPIRHVAPFSRWPACSPYRHRSPACLDSLIDRGRQCRVFHRLAARLPLLVLLGSPILISFRASIRSLPVLRPSEFHTPGPWPRSGLTSGPVSSGRDPQVVLVNCVP